MPMRTVMSPRFEPRYTGTRKGSGRTRCGARRSSVFFSRRDFRLVREPLREEKTLEVTQALVDQLGGLRRGAGGEIAFLEEGDRGAAQGEVARHARSRHPA